MTYSRLKGLLERCVREQKNPFMTYGKFGQMYHLGSFAPAWANRKNLDVAAQECKADKSIYFLDLTFILCSSRTHYPSVIDGRPFSEKNPKPQMDRAREEAQKIIDRFCPGANNPY